MPFETDKETLLNHLKEKNCRTIKFVEQSMSYESLVDQLKFFIETFNCVPDDLKDIVEVIEDGTRTIYGVQYGKSGDLTDPVFVIGGTLNDIILETDANAVYMVGEGTAARILVRNNTTINYILVASGCIIEEIEVEEGSHVKRLDINTCNLYNTTIRNVRNGDEIDGVDYLFIQPLPASTTVPATTTITP